jgi:hypothetical protein
MGIGREKGNLKANIEESRNGKCLPDDDPKADYVQPNEAISPLQTAEYVSLW